jgi:hypothetical protein
MNNNFWTKTTNYKFLGKVLFTKEEICSDTQYEGQIYQINVSSDYYSSEFDLNKKDKKE